jgi:stage II sporulation protein P
VHTHAKESFQPSAAINFTQTSPERSTDTKYNMVAVGDEVAKELEKKGVGVIHLRNLYDYPEYNSSYARSCADVEAAIKKYPSIKIVLDLHRDSITNKEGQKFKITTVIKNEKTAQVMIVVGTDELGLKHDNWRTNLKFAVNLQQKFIDISPNFARPINLRTSRFNGHTAPGAIIIEVGAAGNTLDEALAAGKYIAKAVSGTIK